MRIAPIRSYTPKVNFKNSQPLRPIVVEEPPKPEPKEEPKTKKK